MLWAVITAAAAAIFVICLIAARYYRLKNRKCCPVILLVPVMPDDDLFERRVMSCYWEEAFCDPFLAKDILLVVMKHSANEYTAKRLAQQYASIHVVHISSLNDYLRRNYEEYCFDKKNGENHDQ